MVLSMTGFGKGESEVNGTSLSVEVRTVNGRYGDVSIHQPRALAELESRIKELVLAAISRGRIDVTVNLSGGNNGQGLPSLNRDALDAYRRGLEQLQEALGITGPVDVSTLAGLPGLFSFESTPPDIEETWRALEPACVEAVAQCRAMREVEGARLAQDFRERIATLEALAGRVAELSPNKVSAARQKLEEKLKTFLGPEQVDENRLLMEITLIAERSDITEECVRLSSHNAQFLEALDKGEGVGRRLNFLLQEMLREVNTIGSKAGDAEIAHLVVSMKEEIEKLKEQVLNVE